MEESLQATDAELHGSNPLVSTAEKHWRNTKAKKANPNVIKSELWAPLEKAHFSSTEVNLLENLQCLEQYLWPTFDEDATNYHVLLIVILLNAKRRASLPTWDIFESQPEEFSELFRRILALLLDNSLSLPVRTQVLVCVIGAFQSLENGLIRKACAPLVSISIWQNLHDDEAREKILDKDVQFKKAWRAATRRFEGADHAGKVRMQYERSWLYTLLLEFLELLYESKENDSDVYTYCERFFELLCDLESQFPTRRFVHTLLQDLNVLVASERSPLVRSTRGSLLQELQRLLKHFMNFPLDNRSGKLLPRKQIIEERNAERAGLQRTALKHFSDKLKLLALSNHASIGQRQELTSHLEPLDEEDLSLFAQHLGFRTSYPNKLQNICHRDFVQEVILHSYEDEPTFEQELQQLPVLPTEKDLYAPALQKEEEYDGSHPLALPKLNLQYLATADFLWRSFILYRKEAFYEIRTYIEDIIKRISPKQDANTGQARAPGSRMALRINAPAILNALPPRVGEAVPAEVRAEIILDMTRENDFIRADWDSLQPGDTIFLVSTKGSRGKLLTNGIKPSAAERPVPYNHMRSAEVIQLLDDSGNSIRHAGEHSEGRRPRRRRLLVNLDPIAYAADTGNHQGAESETYKSLNLLVRRRARENNFKSVLETIRRLALSASPLPDWLLDVFLGLGDPAGASYKNLPSTLKTLDFRDTFLDWKHLKEALPEKDVQADSQGEEISQPPYVLESFVAGEDVQQPSQKRVKQEDSQAKGSAKAITNGEHTQQPQSSTALPSRKRRRREVEQEPATETVKVSTYKPPNMGPYPSDVAKPNQVRFTPNQVEAITAGTQPGLTVIVGPPGTGKTDVAVQIINNIYHNFSDERILLVAHSNQALNQLFAKIVALDIDERHLLRLGQGERDLQLDSEASYGKQGRVENFIEHGNRLLGEVNRLAMSIRAPGAHGNSCETAEYFNTVYVQPVWKQYLEVVADADNVAEIVDAFPFHEFFYDAPQPLFPEDATREQALEIVTGCYRHIEKIFVELQDIQPFEVLRRDREKANYLLVKEARIVAMTTTHAAMRREEIAKLGFQYDNVIMEEAAQVTEVENFIPLVMQKPVNGETGHALKRVVLCGDHLQNSPIISNHAYRHFANLEQSMFLRLIRLGVPHVLLDKQGRARESIAELYRWRYPALGSLSLVRELPEFRLANAGLRYDYQFIDVPDYKGRGETQPSPHFIQNEGEAEYAVALYQYMRLLGYPAHKISILTMYAGQRALIKDVLGYRCKNKRLFGLPRTVSTVDKYQGEQNDYIILSLVRTKRPGYLRDVRRLTVALSRARVGLYIFGRRTIFESCPELRPAFELLFSRTDKLELAPGELYPSERLVDEDVKGSEMEGVEHLGQYVFEMTQAKINDLREGKDSLPPAEESARFDEDEEDDEGAAPIEVLADETRDEGRGLESRPAIPPVEE